MITGSFSSKNSIVSWSPNNFTTITISLAGMLLVPAFGYLGACYSSPLAWLLADAFLIPAFFLCKRKVARQLEVGKA